MELDIRSEMNYVRAKILISQGPLAATASPAVINESTCIIMYTRTRYVMANKQLQTGGAEDTRRFDLSQS